MAVSTIKGTEVKTATLGSGVTGTVYYAIVGRVCTFSGAIVVSGALSVGQTLVSGLPLAATANNYPVYATNNNSTTEIITLHLGQTSGTGAINNKAALSGANRALRFSGSYITA